MESKIICWWSGGVTSAVACKKSIDLFGIENCRFIMIDTKNEDEDTYRFKRDCEKWYGKEIETITSQKYNTIQEVWYQHKNLNIAKGAVCSDRLKRKVSDKWLKENTKFLYQVFGFDITEGLRAKAMALNHAHRKPIFPLLLYGLTKKDCIDFLIENKIEIPRSYKWGFHNNNCLQTGCVQGGIGYWQKIKEIFPDKFEKMAKVEHDLTDLKKEPVTMLKVTVNKQKYPLFLKPHPKYPHVKHIGMLKKYPVRPLIECNGFCGSNDLIKRNPTADEINFGDVIKGGNKLF